MPWYIEDSEGLLPVSPFATRAEAQAFCSEIEHGRPVFVADDEPKEERQTPEPQENTYERAMRAERFQ